jgi:isopenicillin N synthase-like dioxygenase
MSEGVPVIDVAALRREGAARCPETVARIGDACREWGFFQVRGHGFSEALRADFEREMREFFWLPTEEKARVRRTADNARGWYDAELTKNVRDWKEIFDFGHLPDRSLPDAHPANRCADGQNQWPPGRPGFRAAMRAWFEACEVLALELIQAVCASLGVSPQRLDESFAGVHTSYLRLNRYPPCPDPAPPDAPDVPTSGQLGVNRHTDAGALTILHQVGVDGLQVLRAGRWELVRPLADAFTINIGDMFQVWSNDRYAAPLHRVVANAGEERFSAPFFMNPSYETQVHPLESVVGADAPARYRPVDWGKFRRRRAEGDYADVGEEVQVAHYRLASASGCP